MACNVHALVEVTGPSQLRHWHLPESSYPVRQRWMMNMQFRQGSAAWCCFDGQQDVTNRSTRVGRSMQPTFEPAEWPRSGRPSPKILHQAVRGNLATHGKAGSADAGPRSETLMASDAGIEQGFAVERVIDVCLDLKQRHSQLCNTQPLRCFERSKGTWNSGGRAHY
jgi:hypothetical protein